MPELEKQKAVGGSPPFFSRGKALRLTLAIVAVAALLLLSLRSRPLLSGTATSHLPIFVDVSQKAGLAGFVNVQGSPRKNYILESFGGGAAFLDYDNDGWLDVLLVRGSTIENFLNKGGDPICSLYHNNGDGTFTDVTEKSGLGAARGWGMGVAVADYDNDGFKDIFITGFGRNFLFHNQGNGTFVDVTDKAGLRGGGWSTGAAFADYDRDGFLDLYVARYVEFDLRNPPRRNSSCVFQGIEVYCGPTGFVGVPDILYHNNGNGTFTDVTAKAGITDLQNKYYGLGVTWGDYDNDGWPDILVANDITPRYLWHNNHDGTFTDQGSMSGVAYDEQGMTQGSMGVDFGDYDNDGWLDITETNFSHEPKELYHNLHNGLFEDMTYPSGIGDISYYYLSWGTQFIDYDNDGWLDIFTVNGHVYPEMDRPNTGTTFSQRPLLFHNKGNGTFEEVGGSSGEDMKKKYTARGAAFGDFDNDGDIDVLVNNIDSHPTLFRNDGGNRLNWVEIKLIGTRSNRDAIGARLTLRAGGLRMIREIKAGGSFASSSDPRAHFGLGNATKVDSLEIRWPSGTVETLKDLPVNKFFTLIEGKSASGG
jgi:hypothetical protein